MDGIELLEQARDAGLSVRAAGNQLVIRGPRSAEPLAKELLAHKPEVMAALEGTPHGDSPALTDPTPAQVAARNRLLERLRVGIEWLTTTHSQLLGTQELHTAQEGKFLEALDLWDALDLSLRSVYAFKRCVTPEGHCPKESPVACRACGSRREQPA